MLFLVTETTAINFLFTERYLDALLLLHLSEEMPFCYDVIKHLKENFHYTMQLIIISFIPLMSTILFLFYSGDRVRE